MRANRTVNEAQQRVLRWIADGCPEAELPTEGFSYKTSAYALRDRGLVTVSRRGGHWRAAITDAGRHYLKHGTYPPPPSATGPASPPKRKPTQTSTSATPGDNSPEASPVAAAADETAAAEDEHSALTKVAGTAELPILRQIRKPHPAIRELVDHPKRVDLSTEIRRRVHLISHTLVQEALRRGWRVTPVKSEMRQSWPSGRERWWPSNDLYRIDAGQCEVGIQFRVKTKRVEHVETPEEARRRARGQYVWAPRWDYHPTDILRLFLYQGTRSTTSWEDTARIPIENRLVAVLDQIEQSTKAVIARREAEQRRWEEEQRRREEERRQEKRVAHYDTWLDTLLTLQRRSREHAELASFVTELQKSRGAIDDEARPQFDIFLEWAYAHLEASDPFNYFDMPTGPPPEMPYLDWVGWKDYFEKQKSYSKLPWHLR